MNFCLYIHIYIYLHVYEYHHYTCKCPQHDGAGLSMITLWQLMPWGTVVIVPKAISCCSIVIDKHSGCCQLPSRLYHIMYHAQLLSGLLDLGNSADINLWHSINYFRKHKIISNISLIRCNEVVVSIVAADDLVLKHQVISICNADSIQINFIEIWSEHTSDKNEDFSRG